MKPLNKRNQSGFTLIELLVVVIIVAVLAAVATPLFTGQIDRAKASEAEAGLGSVRTGLRSLSAEASSYASANGLNPVAANIGLKAGDLKGRYFDDPDYTAITANATTFCAGVSGNSGTSTAPKKTEVAGVSRSINQDGDIFKTANCT